MVVPLAGFFAQYKLTIAGEKIDAHLAGKKYNVLIPPVVIQGQQFNTDEIRSLYNSIKPTSVPVVNKEVL